MAGDVFGSTYAGAYDAFYATKDYAAECDRLEREFKRFGDGRVRSLLDLGCGTGGHAIPLSQRGYKVTGLDRSAEMLARAKEKAEGAADAPEFVQGDVRNFDLGREFDAVVMMFAVLGYQTENADVLSTLKSVVRHLRPGGVFAFDVWYGPGVLHDPPGERARTFQDGNREIIRLVRGYLDVPKHVATVKYDLWSVNGGDVDRVSERHTMRFFFPKELELFLELAGLRLASLTAFGDADRAPTIQDWNAFAVAVKG